MRDFFSIVVLIFAVVALGLFELPDQARLMGRGVVAEAAKVTADYPHDLTITSRGTDLTVEGPVPDMATRRDILRKLGRIEAVGEVTDKLKQMPVPEVFGIEMSKGPEGALATGFVPLVSVGVEIEAVLGVEEDPEAETEPLVLAAGAPEGWGDVAVRGAEALALMETGEVRLSGRALAMTGTALLPATVERAEALLAQLPEGFAADLTLAAIDDGRPYSLLVQRDPVMGLRIAGKLPPGADAGALVAPLGTAQEVAVQVGKVDLGVPEFDPLAARAVDVARHLARGTVAVTPPAVTVTGGPVTTEVRRVLAQLEAALPKGYDLHLATVPEDDGAPFALELRVQDGQITGTGKLPGNLAEDIAAMFEGVSVEGPFRTAPYPDLEGWSAIALAGAAALAELDSGALRIEAKEVSLEGIAANPEREAAALAALAALPGGIDPEVRLLLADDGTPPVYAITFTPEGGATAEGKVPNGLDLVAMSDALGVPVAGAVRMSPQGGPGHAAARLGALAGWIDLVERVSVTVEGERMQISAVLSPGVPEGPIEDAMRAVLGFGEALTLTGMTGSPAAGTRRMNVATGAEVSFASGRWLPVLDGPTDPAECGAALDAAIPVHPVIFSERSAALTLEGYRSLNHIAVLMRACASEDRPLRVAGHGDEGVGEGRNRQLARRRTETVLQELRARGIPRSNLRAAPPKPDARRIGLTL